MTGFTGHRGLGSLDAARSRHNWARSAVAAADGRVFTGTADGRTLALDSALDGVQWDVSGDHRIVSMAANDDVLITGERGGGGTIRALDSETGEQRWSYTTTDDVGAAAKDSLFFLPYVVDVAVTDERIVAAARRYERDGEKQIWSSVVLGFDPDGEVQWCHSVAASPIAMATDSDRVAVAYNRCPEPDQHGVVVLDAETGAKRATWDPELDAERRVGDVAFAGDDIAVACHGDKRGYLIDADGDERWSVDLAVKQSVGEETVYAYPNHVCVADGVIVFVTGNTFAESTRDPEARHPREHAVFAVEDGENVWTHDIGGFARDVESVGERVFIPSAQNFRRRSSETHGVHGFDAREGHDETAPLSGIPTALTVDDGVLAVVEEPVEYHDEGVTHGAYRLHARPTP